MVLRTISAIVGITFLILVATFFRVEGIVYVCSLVSLIACYEFANMILPNKVFEKNLFFTLSFSLHILFGYFTQSFLLVVFYYFLIIFIFVFQRKVEIEKRFTNISIWSLGVLYCGLLTGTIVYGTKTFKMDYFLAILIASFLTDTLAYLGGKFMGKRPLAPKISPNKTIEGALCGLIGGSIVTCLFLNSLVHSGSILFIIFFSLMASFFSQIGDLYESMLKRIFGIKDSGKILPGHGGALDRIDGLLFSAPVILMWMSLFIKA
jgi:phosphatidate cytidylyltransferase